MSARVLFVDDEFNVLAAIKRQLHRQIEVELARGGLEALDRLKSSNRYAAIVSDLRMPGIDGVRLLTQVRALAPDVVRIILTGNLEPWAAIAAVNDVAAFRVLIKPCDTAVLGKALGEAVEEHYARVRAREEIEERVRLQADMEQTNAGAVALLKDLLDRLNPFAYERAGRLRAYAHKITAALDCQDADFFETAVQLSQIGYVSVGPNILEKATSEKQLTIDEQGQLDGQADIGVRILSHVPYLKPAAMVLAGQSAARVKAEQIEDTVSTGIKILRVVLAYDTLLATGLPSKEVISRLKMDRTSFPPHMVAPLEELPTVPTGTAWVVKAQQIELGMVFEEDLVAGDGTLLASRGQAASAPLIARVRDFDKRVGVSESIRVRVLAGFNQVFASHR